MILKADSADRPIGRYADALVSHSGRPNSCTSHKSLS